MTEKPEVFEVKKGDTYQLTCAYKIDGVVQDITLTTIRSQVRTKRRNNLVVNCTITKLDGSTPGVKESYTVTLSPVQTAVLDVGDYESDIEYTFTDGTKETTPTFILRISEKQTGV